MTKFKVALDREGEGMLELAVLTAISYDSGRITEVEGRETDLIKSYLFDYPDWTVAQVVGIFGQRALCFPVEEDE